MEPDVRHTSSGTPHPLPGMFSNENEKQSSVNEKSKGSTQGNVVEKTETLAIGAFVKTTGVQLQTQETPTGKHYKKGDAQPSATEKTAKLGTNKFSSENAASLQEHELVDYINKNARLDKYLVISDPHMDINGKLARTVLFSKETGNNLKLAQDVLKYVAHKLHHMEKKREADKDDSEIVYHFHDHDGEHLTSLTHEDIRKFDDPSHIFNAISTAHAELQAEKSQAAAEPELMPMRRLRDLHTFHSTTAGSSAPRGVEGKINREFAAAMLLQQMNIMEFRKEARQLARIDEEKTEKSERIERDAIKEDILAQRILQDFFQTQFIKEQNIEVAEPTTYGMQEQIQENSVPVSMTTVESKATTGVREDEVEKRPDGAITEDKSTVRVMRPMKMLRTLHSNKTSRQI